MALEPITNELATIESSRYGSEMRMAIHDALEKLYNDINIVIPTPTPTPSGATGTTILWGGTDTQTTGFARFVNTGGVVYVYFEVTVNTAMGSSETIELCDIPMGYTTAYTGAFTSMFNPNGPSVGIATTDDKIIVVTGASETLPVGKYKFNGVYMVTSEE